MESTIDKAILESMYTYRSETCKMNKRDKYKWIRDKYETIAQEIDYGRGNWQFQTRQCQERGF